MGTDVSETACMWSESRMRIGQSSQMPQYRIFALFGAGRRFEACPWPGEAGGGCPNSTVLDVGREPWPVILRRAAVCPKKLQSHAATHRGCNQPRGSYRAAEEYLSQSERSHLGLD